jgi:diaminohydroxyphosphoribosylaminopyrimidine deaminase/5-amino-6-(5-phosphoribosylamino)uracil reductase
MSTKINKSINKDNFFMSLAFDLAKSKLGLTGVNPSVGCVIVGKDEKILSVGSTGIGGVPHAEKNAIDSSVESLNGSTLYSTLEPCIHYGKTPPCTNAIIKSGIKKVIFSLNDIDPRVKNRAKKILSKKGILVKKNLLIDKAKIFYNPYIINKKYKIPYVIGKIAVTQNNVIYSDQTKKITSVVSDKLTHYLRYKNDSILISSKTANIDNPRLDCRLNGLKEFSPRRIILDTNLELNNNSFIFKTINKKNTIIFHNRGTKEKITRLKKKGALLIRCKTNKNQFFNLKLILKKLYDLNVRNILVEGGQKLTENCLKHRIFNEFYLFKSNKKDPLKSNFKFFKNSSLLKKVFKHNKKLANKLNKDKVIIYN